MSGTPANFSRHARVRARRSAVQAIYQWEMNNSPMNDVIEEFIRERTELKKADADYFREVLLGTAGRTGELNEAITPHLDRPLPDLDPVERAILLLGTYELMHRTEIPWRVIVNESVELAKMFGADQSHKYINGVMDKIARVVRTTEMHDAGQVPVR